MIATDRDALVCDLAETYHVFDYRSLPARFVATLAEGLPEGSRIKLKIAGMPYATDTLLLALAVDRLSLLVWMNTEDGNKNRNRPESIYAKMLGLEQKSRAGDIVSFDSAADFEKAKAAIMNGGEVNGRYNESGQCICPNHPVRKRN